MKKKLLPILVAAILILTPAMSVLAADWFVDDTAPPLGDGTTWGTAFNTLADAFGAWAPGDYILVDKVSNEAPWIGVDPIEGMLRNMPAGESVISVTPAADLITWTKQGAGTTVAGILYLEDNPGTYEPGEAIYFDLYSSTPVGIDSFTFRMFFPADFIAEIYALTGIHVDAFQLYYWNGAAWIFWSSQSFVGTTLAGTVTNITNPTLTQLAGLPIAIVARVYVPLSERVGSWIPLLFGFICIIGMLGMVYIGKVYDPTILITSGIITVVGYIILVVLTS